MQAKRFLRANRVLTGIAGIGAVGVVAVMVIAPRAFAATSDILTYGSIGGTNVTVNDSLSSNLKAGTNATLYTTTNGTTGIVCATSTLSATVSANPAAPGTAQLSLTASNFSKCTQNIFQNFHLDSVTFSNLPYGGSVNDSASPPVTFNNVQATLVFRFRQTETVTCIYSAATLSGAGSFTNQQLTGSSGFGCPTTMYYTAGYTTVDTSVTGGPTVFVN